MKLFDLRTCKGKSTYLPVELGRDALDAIVTQNQIFQTGEVGHFWWDRGDQVSSQIQHLKTGHNRHLNYNKAVSLSL